MGGSVYKKGDEGGVCLVTKYYSKKGGKEVGKVLGGDVVNNGRRASILCGDVSFFARAFMNVGAQNIAMLIIGRCLLGVGIGFDNQHSWGWRLSLRLAAVPATLMFVGAWFLSETPNGLVEQGRLEEGRRGFGSGASLWSSTITSGTLVVATFISMAFADKFGRRALFLEAGVEMIICMIRQNDRLAVRKLVTTLTRGTVRLPLAQFLLLRYTSLVIRESGMNTQSTERAFYDFMEGCLRHKSEMVIFEAARAITELNGVSSREPTPAIMVLQLFLSSSLAVLRIRVKDNGAHAYTIKEEVHPKKEPHLGKEYHNALFELVNIRSIAVGKLWCNKKAIFPKGYRSRVKFRSFLNPALARSYIVEIHDPGLIGPIYKVFLEEYPSESFMDVSTYKCWELVLQRLKGFIKNKL
ncbi:coatomer subunit gamma-2, partial [Tanacetum coccineum]